MVGVWGSWTDIFGKGSLTPGGGLRVEADEVG